MLHRAPLLLRYLVISGLILLLSSVIHSKENVKAPLFEQMGDHHHPVATGNELAQRYFDQGLVLAFGFNHAEAARSFRQAQALDPDLAMAYWGEALVLGPNINAPMTAEHAAEAVEAMKKARKHIDEAIPRHRDYIEALDKRYGKKQLENRAQQDLDYARAMAAVAEKHPEDHDVQALYAEALMDTMPWDYWTPGGKPKAATRDVLQTLERVLARKPRHPLANHLYIHAVEAVNPEWAVASADRLGALVPDAGHLVHMPAHIYIRVGRYDDANAANEEAIEADQSYISQCHAQGVYALGYVPHNHHFLWYGKMMTGESEDALDAARHVADYVDTEKMRLPGLGALQHYYSLPMQTYVRFGMRERALQHPRPPRDLKYPLGLWHFMRGMALAQQGKVEEAKSEHSMLVKAAEHPSVKNVTIWDINGAAELLAIADKVLSARIAEAEEDLNTALIGLREAREMESALKYDEPPTWFLPVRHLLGTVLLKADNASEAEAVYREDLAVYPDNGWALFGLYQALAEQGKTAESEAVKRRFEEAWDSSDVMLKESRL